PIFGSVAVSARNSGRATGPVRPCACRPAPATLKSAATRRRAMLRMTMLLAAALTVWSVHAAASEWTAYGGDGRGQRYAPAAEITPKNVGELELAWTFRTGELGQGFHRAGEALTFE